MLESPCAATSFENRMANWASTVRTKHGAGGGCCCDWAASYVACRNKREEALAVALQITEPSSELYHAHVDELDGWLVEFAWRTLIHFDQKQILRFKYVFGYPNHFIKSKLHINDSSIRIVLGRAINNLTLVLDSLEVPARIRHYNLHARCVPRLEALAVPLGTVAPLGSEIT
ncbi:hypothetical protein QN372_00760 [Undibacterium sp. RTI2.1]|uniref:hypothetical protein n=1 Tax=unclassified Undibacterium TaxID=2630295 RepID=UPI002AB39967|nr:MULTISPECIES: hypothetical protein [unclassified Undibacterium]MDY7537667.1 hypothetical protein [Undibacterium sp. 5I1]MEB0029269.1 hypothetical protein [Undibacterium sp. RTI2.1]MEB0115577.1 hypothetical protein [Undibacterium sp. RTI2.2]MEB0256404.1 hypothetical protein [Undibacterium sp. 5I1]